MKRQQTYVCCFQFLLKKAAAGTRPAAAFGSPGMAARYRVKVPNREGSSSDSLTQGCP